MWSIIFLTEGKGPHDRSGCCRRHFLFGGCGGSDADSPLSWSVWCNYWHRAKWRQVNFYFYFRSWDFWLNFKFLCTVFFRVYPFTYYCLSKSWWGNICLLGVPYMLWMHMYTMYSFVRMTPTAQKNVTTTTSSSLPQNISCNSSWYYQIFQHLPFYYFIFLFSSWIGISI